MLLLLPALSLSAFRGQQVTSDGDVTTVVQTPTEPLTLDAWARAIGLNGAATAAAPVRSPNMPGEFWEFVPAFEGSASVQQGAQQVAFETSCYKSVSVTATISGGAATVTVASSGKKKLLSVCADSYLITTTKSFHVETVRSLLPSARRTIHWSGFDANELADVSAHGFRIFRFSKSLLDELPSVIETARLFLQPLFMKRVTTATAQRNIDFLRTYAPGGLGEHFGEPRNITDVVPHEDEIGDGDAFCILRLDGLDPMIDWGTGGACGHMTMALRIDGVLNVVESQSKSSYWPKDFVQRNTYAEWISMAQAADYNVLHLRLSAASKARFDASKAAAAFSSQYEGLLYGFESMLWGWFDVGNDNFPTPLDVHLIATLFAILDPLLTPLLGTTPSLWNNAIAQRLGLGPGVGGNVSFGMNTRDLYGIMQARNLTLTDIFRMAERDEWIYPRPACGRAAGCTGPSQVCNVFVCKMWKAGGLFDVDFNCGEQVPGDTYEMDIFDKAPTLSAECMAAEPDNTEYCQIMGKYRLTLRHFSTVKPFAHMRELCPSKAPDYTERFSQSVDTTC